MSHKNKPMLMQRKTNSMPRRGRMNRQKQQGNVIIIAVFVIVVMGLLAANLTRINWSNQDTLSREAKGTQAWFLAHSGNEWALMKMFPLNGAEDLAALEANCIKLNTLQASAATALINRADLSCESLEINCSSPDANLPDDLKYFQITSRSRCSEGKLYEVERVQETWVKGE